MSLHKEKRCPKIRHLFSLRKQERYKENARGQSRRDEMKNKILKTVSEKLYQILKKSIQLPAPKKDTRRQEKNGIEQKRKPVSLEHLKEESQEWLRSDYDAMNGEEFEYFCAYLLQANGFTEVKLTKKTGDLGVDILAKKDQITYAVQCKCHMSKIGNQAVRDVYSGKECYHCMVGAVMTNQFFTNAAIDLAEEHNILLWDRTEIENLIKAAKKKVYTAGKDIIPGEYWIVGEKEQRWKCIVSKDQNGREKLFEIISEGRYPVEVRDGEYLILEEAYLQPVTFRQCKMENSGWFAAKVGRELEAGEYQLFAADEEVSGYYAIYRAARYMETEKLQSDFFENSIFISLEEGTYLLGENCYFQKI